LRAVRHAIVDESREGRAAEIVAWANSTSALAVGAAVTAFGWSRLPVHAAWIGLASSAFAFLVLRLALTHRHTVWFAAFVGTLTVASLGGTLAWLFGHVVDTPEASSIAAVIGALIASVPPAWSYAHLARRRAEAVRDSLVDPTSVPSSR
jgi:hypothetical protein